MIYESRDIIRTGYSATTVAGTLALPWQPEDRNDITAIRQMTSDPSYLILNIPLLILVVVFFLFLSFFHIILE